MGSEMCIRDRGNSATAGGRIENGDILDVRERLTQAIDAYFEK